MHPERPLKSVGIEVCQRLVGVDSEAVTNEKVLNNSSLSTGRVIIPGMEKWSMSMKQILLSVTLVQPH